MSFSPYLIHQSCECDTTLVKTVLWCGGSLAPDLCRVAISNVVWDLLAPDLCRVAISNVVWDPLAPDLYRVAISNVVWDPLAPDLCRVGRAVRSEIRPLELGAAVGIGGSD